MFSLTIHYTTDLLTLFIAQERYHVLSARCTFLTTYYKLTELSILNTSHSTIWDK